MIERITNLDEYKSEYELSVNDPEGFWAKQAESFLWYKKWNKTLEWNFSEPDIKWFIGGKR